MNRIEETNTNNNSNISRNIVTEELMPMDYIRNLQHRTENIRNICVLAHVDHGKTSLVDSLISYNNIINPRLAGDIRYMDSRPDEQERCITMKSSSISISYESEVNQDTYLINLIDSPGHVDFSSEIFSALKICDGAIIVIDVVEGICSQTESVIKQAWDEKIKCVLVLNKIDRLITEVHMDSHEAYIEIYMILEKVNSLMGSLIMRDIHIKSEREKKEEMKNSGNSENSESKDGEGAIDIDKLIEEKENELYFSPDKGNVIFASAIDNWGFTLDTFSDILSKKIGFKKEAIKKLLWGDFFFNAKKKKVYKDPVMAGNSKPMFVEFVLDNIYKLYKMILIEKNQEKIAKAASSINVVISAKELANIEKNPRNILKNMFRQWLPIPPAIFDVTIHHLPNPITGCLNKIDVLFPPYKLAHHDYPVISQLKEYLSKRSKKEAVSEDNVPSLAFISKMVPLQRKNIAGEVFTYNTEKDREAKDEVKFMAFARNYCGSFKKGQEFYVIGPKHDPKLNIYDIQKFKFDQLYFFMGQHLEELSVVPPGNIFSIGGLENYIFKTATISSVFDCPSIIPSNINKNSIIKVSISTDDIQEMSKLVDGLKKLYKSDPAVDYYVQSNGEHILVTAGEVHLERCIKDLEDHLAKVKVKTSAPIVNFKEGLANKNYQFKRKNETKATKQFEVIEKEKDKERKKDLNKAYTLNEGDKNIDIDDQKEILKSCTPMILSREVKTKKPVEKVSHKVKDIKNLKETKTNSYIEKNVRLNEPTTEKEIKGFAEDVTPNKLCKFSMYAVGMTNELIEFLEKNENLLKDLDNRDYVVDKDLFSQFLEFKEKLLNIIENKRLRQLVESNLICFGLNNCGQNMLVIKNMSKRYSYFNKVRLEGEEEKKEEEEMPLEQPVETTVDSDVKSTSCKSKDTKEKASNSNKNVKREKTTNQMLVSTESASFIDDSISNNLKNQVTPREFLNSVKSGFELAVASGPLCEENMYGVIFIIEDIQFSKNSSEVAEKEDTEKEKEKLSDNSSANPIRNEEDSQTSLQNPTAEINTQEETKSEDHSINSLKFNVYGPFLGQVIGTVKDCCRKAFLNGEPRLFEAIYLCLFQIKQEHVGKIHSVVSKRRGKIINELPNDDATICTIEAVVPVVESFGFVEEIRKNTSGMANPMLQFHKWEMIDVDPFYLPVTKEIIDNFGVNIDTPNLAKNYINKIRLRKGLPTDEKIIKGADKQTNLSKKR